MRGLSGLAARFALLRELVSREADGRHPKVGAVIAHAVSGWKRGEKTLIFCFRTNNVARLSALVSEAIDARFAARRRSLGLSDARLITLRRRLTAREGDLSPLLADRVLWSWWWHRKATEGATPWPAEALRLLGPDLSAMAELASRFGRRIDEERPDRLFLMRVTEAVLARRLLKIPGLDTDTRTLLGRVSENGWVAFPYAVNKTAMDAPAQADGHDPGGAASKYRERPSEGATNGARTALPPGEVAQRLEERRLRARQRRETALVHGVLDSAVDV